MLVGAPGGIYLLVLLACPISMGLMMVFMGRGMMGGQKRGRAGTPKKGESVEELKAEQARLAERIAALDAGDSESSETTLRTTSRHLGVEAEAREPERTPTPAG